MGDPKEDSAASQLAGITSDGKTPTEQNPWYVLATIAGEQQSSDGLDEDLQLKNRAYWNAWAGQHLSAEEKAGIKSASDRSILKDTPEWSEVEAEVTEVFAKRLSGLDLPIPAQGIYFQNVAFSAPVSFNGFYFPATADFRYATFSGVAFFPSATFSENADFADATFSRDAYFLHARFSGDARFFNATFSEYAFFNLATFSGVAIFLSATFSRDANFSEATFSGPTKFVMTKFLGRANFTDASFDAPCNFREAQFKVAYPDLEGTLLQAKTNISAEDDFWPKTGKQKTDPEWEDEPQTDKQAAQSCAHLRQNMAAQGLPEAAHFFFRREMTHRSRISRRWERPFYTLYRGVEYGYGVWQPVAGIIATWALGAGALWCWGCMSGWTAAGLSFSNIFRFFGFQRVHFEPGIINSLPFPLEVMTAVQTLVGFVLLFLLGLGLRNRFRLK